MYDVRVRYARTGIYSYKKKVIENEHLIAEWIYFRLYFWIYRVPDLTWDHLETKILVPKCWGFHKNVQTTDYCRIEDTIALTAESYFLFYIDPSIDIDIIALYVGPLMRYVPDRRT